MAYDGLIDPAQFPFRSEQMDVVAPERAAGVLRQMGAGVLRGAEDLRDSWAGLRPAYEGPSQERVWDLMTPLPATAGRVQRDLARAARRLDELAGELGLLRARLADLERRAAAFRAEVVDGVRAPASEGADFHITWGGGWTVIPWNQDTDTVARNEDLLLEHAKVVEDITKVSADCHNALMDLVAWAGDEHDVAAVEAEALMDRRQEYPWGTPVAEDRSWGESVGHGAYMFGFTVATAAVGLVSGYDLRMQKQRPGFRGEILTGIGNVLLSGSVTAGTSALAMTNPSLAAWLLGRFPSGAQHWVAERHETTATAAGELVGVDVQAHLAGEDALWRWREDGVATGTESVLNIASMFVPSGGAASGALRTGALGARLLRVATGAVDVVVPGASALTYGGIRVVSGLRTALARVDDVPVVGPNPVGTAAEMVDAADTPAVVAERPVSDAVFGGEDSGGVSSLFEPEPAAHSMRDAVDDGHAEGGQTHTEATESPEHAGSESVQETDSGSSHSWIVDPADYSETISHSRQAKHMKDSPRWEHGGYFTDIADAQAVLDAFHHGRAEVLGVTTRGHVVVRFEDVVGFNHNPSNGYANQPTNVFFIKGTRKVSVVPCNPQWRPPPSEF